MTDEAQPHLKIAQFRQTLLWPVQLIANDDQQIQSHWESLKALQGQSPWQEIQDEFKFSSAPLSEARYQEFVTFMPFAQRFLYGEGKHGEKSGGYGESPIHIFTRNDVKQVRIVFDDKTPPITLNVPHIELYFFFDIDVAILVLEVTGKEIDLPVVMETLYRLGRTYPNFWDHRGQGGHCAKRVEWLDADGQVLAQSDYENKQRYLSFVKEHHVPCVSKHWEFLMYPLVQHYSDAPGDIRYREIEYQRMPLMSYLSMDHVEQLTRGDMMRLCFVTRAWDSLTLPYTEAFLKDFEQQYCYDRYWDDSHQDGWNATRIMCTGQNFIVLGSQKHSFFTDNTIGIKANYQNQYFLLYLIAHFQKAALLMLSDRLVQAISRLDIQDPESHKRFRRSIRHTTEIFLRFTHRYWFQSVSDQAVARDIFKLMLDKLETADLFEKMHRRIMDMAEYLEAEEIKRQADTVVRLTVVTILGLIGTMTSGLLGMNIFDLTSTTPLQKGLYFVMMFIPVSILTFYTVIKSRRLSVFLDALSNEKLSHRNKLSILKSVWMESQRD